MQNLLKMSNVIKTPVKKESSASNDSLKRKSFEREDAENCSPNQELTLEEKSIKKSRVLRSQTSRSSTERENPTSKLSSVMKSRSALPRYTSSRTSQISSAADAKKRSITEKGTAERNSVISTPSKSKVSTSPPRSQKKTSTPPRSATIPSSILDVPDRPSILKNSSRRKSGRKSLIRINSGRIRGFFQNAAIVNEEKINELIAPKLKVKCKWDYRDKTKKQTEVIADLKNALKDTITEFKTVQDNCVSAETTMEELIYDLRKELQETVKANTDLKKNEAQLKKDYARLSNECASCTTKLRSLEKEIGPLRRQAEADKNSLSELQQALSQTTEAVLTREREVIILNERLSSLSEEKAIFSSSTKAHIDQVWDNPSLGSFYCFVYYFLLFSPSNHPFFFFSLSLSICSY
jgi:hypothetical protein